MESAIDIELKNHKHILLVGDHYNPLGVARSLGQQGLYPEVIVVSKHPILLSHCKYVKTLHRVDTYEEGYDYLISHYGNEPVKPFVYTGMDKVVDILDSHYDYLKDRFYIFNAGKQGRMHDLMNKDVITTMAEEAGFRIPKKEVVNHGELPRTLKYPIITKTIMSIMGGWKNDVFICNNEEELKAAYPKIKTPKLMIQEYIHKKNEWCFEGISVNNGRDVYIPFIVKYLRFSNKSYGNYMTVEPLKNEDLRKKLYDLMRKTQFEGIFDIEFLEGEDGNLYFLEVNFRSTTWSYSLTSGNVNEPYLWAKSTLQGGIDYSSIRSQETVFTAMNEMSDFKENVPSRKIGFFKWLGQMRKAQCKYYYSKDDPKPFYAYLFKPLLIKLNRI